MKTKNRNKRKYDVYFFARGDVYLFVIVIDFGYYRNKKRLLGF